MVINTILKRYSMSDGLSNDRDQSAKIDRKKANVGQIALKRQAGQFNSKGAGA